MKTHIYILGLSLFMLMGCGSKKNLETLAPFSLGEAYGQSWSIDETTGVKGYELVVAVLSLENDKADLKNVYHKGKMAPITIELTDKGIMGIVEFGEAVESPEEFPFDLTDTQAVISYVHKEKVKYYRINGIQQNLPVSYSSLREKNSR
ncbi:hypothetical protein D9V96_007300 [Zobellia laminariae]|uniref:hypothetical protein n=1 Tax=Zobellia laminariae TaxID=248906 RepID=UPI0012D923F9